MQKKTKRCFVKIYRLPADVLDKPFYRINLESDFGVQGLKKLDIKNEIKIENHDDLDDPIYEDSVSILCFDFLSFYEPNFNKWYDNLLSLEHWIH